MGTSPDNAPPDTPPADDHSPTDPHSEAQPAASGTEGAADQGDLAAIYRRSKPDWMRIALRLTGSTTDAEDLVAEAFTRTMEILRSRGEPISNLPGYVARVIQNLQWHAWRRGRRLVIEPADVEEALGIRGAALTPELDSMGVALSVRTALQTLPESWREILWYTEVEGMGPSDLAASMHMSPGAVSMLAWRARQGLRTAYLAQELPPPASPQCRVYAPDIAAKALGTLGPRAAKRLERHLHGCAACRAQVDNAALTLQSLEVALLPALGTLGLAGLSLAAKAGAAGATSGAGALTAAGTTTLTKSVIGVLGALALAGGGLAAYLALRPVPAPTASVVTVMAPVTLAAAPVPTHTVSMPAAPSIPTPTPLSTIDPQPELDPLPSVGSPTPEPPSSAPAPTLQAAAQPAEEPSAPITNDSLPVAVDVSAAASTGTVTVLIAPTVAGDHLTAKVNLPAGVGLQGAGPWTCSQAGTVAQCALSGASAGSFTLSLASSGGAGVSGTVAVSVTVEHSPTYISTGALSSPLTLPAS